MHTRKHKYIYIHKGKRVYKYKCTARIRVQDVGKKVGPFLQINIG